MKEIQISILKGLTEKELEEIRQSGYIRTASYKKETLILQTGQIVSELGIVLSGSVNIENIDLWGNKNILSYIPEGHVFAETYALCQVPMMVDVLAGENCRILFLNINRLMDSENQEHSWYQKLSFHLLQVSLHKNLALSSRIFCTSSKSVRGRVMTYLSSEAVKSGSMEITIPFNRQQMADYLNLERSALSKELGRMRNDGILEFRKNLFLLHKLQA